MSSDSKVLQTQKMLAKHHRDGEVFAQLMMETFESRFNEDFWAYWKDHIEPSLPEEPCVIDLGAGPGMFLKAIIKRHPKAQAYGVECAPYMLDAVDQLPDNAHMITADLHDPHLPLEEACADVAVASVVLHEMHQPVKTLLDIHRCLRPGGLLYILDWVRAPLELYLQHSELEVFNTQTSAEQLEDLFVHFIEHNRFSRDDLEFLLLQSGYEIADSSDLLQGRQARILARKK